MKKKEKRPQKEIKAGLKGANLRFVQETKKKGWKK